MKTKLRGNYFFWGVTRSAKTAQLVVEGSDALMTKRVPLTPPTIMDDPTAADDEKKPFDALGAPNDDDLQPDPDEHIMLESGHGRVWLVKVFPRFQPVTPLGYISHPDSKISDGALVQV